MNFQKNEFLCLINYFIAFRFFPVTDEKQKLSTNKLKKIFHSVIKNVFLCETEQILQQ